MKTKELKLIVLCLCLFAKFSLSFSQTNNISNENEYPIDDPRNPNCPCHQHQKLAEQQYYLLNLKVNVQNTNTIKLNNIIQNLHEKKINHLNLPVRFIENRKKSIKFLGHKNLGKKKFLSFYRKKKHHTKSKKIKCINGCFNWT